MRYGFYAGNVIKYMQRAHAKGGLEDFKKAKHYMDKVEALLKEYPNLINVKVLAGCVPPIPPIDQITVDKIKEEMERYGSKLERKFM